MEPDTSLSHDSVRSELERVRGIMTRLQAQIIATERENPGMTGTAAQRLAEIQQGLTELEADPAHRPLLTRVDIARHDLRNHQLLSYFGAAVAFGLLFLAYAWIQSHEPFKASYSAGIIFTAFLHSVLFVATYGALRLIRRVLATSSARIAAAGTAPQAAPLKVVTIALSVFFTSLLIDLAKTLPRRDGYFDNEILKPWIGSGFSGTIGLFFLYYTDVLILAAGLAATTRLIKRLR